MKKSVLTCMVLTLAFLCGCTQYNGHIGPIFGSWALTEMKEDGHKVNLEDETLFSFQNEVVQVIRLTDDYGGSETRYGNFTVTDKVLTLRFQALPTESGSYMYTTPYWLGLPEDGVPILLDIRKLNGSEMQLTLDSGGKRLEYSFRKTW